MPSQQWSGLTSSLAYILRSTEHLLRVDPTQPEPCILAVATIAARLHLVFPCFPCSRFIHHAEYLRHCEDRLARALRRAHAPHVPPPCAAAVARDFTRLVLYPAGAAHRCPSGSFAPVHDVDILVQPRVHAAVERAILESFEEARARTKTQPASRRAVVDLLIARAEEEVKEGRRFESGWSGECVICMDEIDKPRESLKLPCSHVFHQTCLVRWFQTSHVCPLCRYQMPTDD